jgi:hypothetical protein
MVKNISIPRWPQYLHFMRFQRPHLALPPLLCVLDPTRAEPICRAEDNPLEMGIAFGLDKYPTNNAYPASLQQHRQPKPHRDAYVVIPLPVELQGSGGEPAPCRSSLAEFAPVLGAVQGAHFSPGKASLDPGDNER